MRMVERNGVKDPVHGFHDGQVVLFHSAKSVELEESCDPSHLQYPLVEDEMEAQRAMI